MWYIQLTRGFLTAVDDDMVEELNSYRWYASGGAGRPARRLKTGNRGLVYMYHQILDVNPKELKPKGLVVDHIDRDPLNNQRHNLRIVSHKDNMLNTLRHELRVGVAFDSQHCKWKAYLDEAYKPRINIGTYKTKIEAEQALSSYRCTNG